MVPHGRPERKDREARRKGRRLVMIIYFSLVVLVIAVAGWQVTSQVFAQRAGSHSDDPIDCIEGIRSLMAAIDLARSTTSASHEQESDAVHRFRSSLDDTAWKRRGDIQRACQGDPDRLRTLDAVLHLGYTEEHAVRRNAVELAAVRRRAVDMVRQHIPPTSSEPVPHQP